MSLLIKQIFLSLDELSEAITILNQLNDDLCDPKTISLMFSLISSFLFSHLK